jgi:hypothetical protein
MEQIEFPFMRELEEMDPQEIDRLATAHWQDDLGKFFPKSKGPTYTELNMFTAGFRAALKMVYERTGKSDRSLG